MVLVDVAEVAVKKCESLGVDEAEAFAQRRKTTEVVLERGEIQSERTKTRLGIGIRVVKERKLGFAHSSMIDEPTIEKICRTASRLAESSTPNPEWVSLPLPRNVSRTPAGIYDVEVASLGCEDVLNLVSQGYDAVRNADSRVSIDTGKLSASSEEIAIASSHGISLEEKGTILSFFLVCVAKEEEATSSFSYEYDISRTLKNFLPEKVGVLGSEKALASLNPKSVESFEGEAVLSPDVAAEVLFEPVIGSVNADNVQRGRSAWANKIGEEVADSKVRLIDEGLLPYGIGSSSFDAEGVPSQRTVVIENGILSGFLYDSYTANKEGVESTGNAARSDYSTLPSISISNLLLESGSKRLEDLISEVDEGIVVSRFSGNVNPQSGDFSGVAKQASYIENGEVKFSLRETMVSGNTFQALSNIVEIGSERRATLMSVYTAPILLKNMKIVSR